METVCFSETWCLLTSPYRVTAQNTNTKPFFLYFILCVKYYIWKAYNLQMIAKMSIGLLAKIMQKKYIIG
jgi:hypothetical protein